jgi:hypothetical protein
MMLVDSHLHFVGFLQDTDGIHALLDRMDEAGIVRAVLFGMPVVKKWAAFEPRDARGRDGGVAKSWRRE